MRKIIKRMRLHNMWKGYIQYFEKMGDAGREKYFLGCIRGYERRWLETGKRQQYFKQFGKESDDYCVVMMFWAPGGHTRPHEHLYAGKGSPAKIHVLYGGLVQELFDLSDEKHECVKRNEYSAGSEFQEEPDSLHRISNKSPCDWAVSMHEFVPGFQMRVYDFQRNLQWIVDGHEDTLGDPPENAEQIQPS